MTKYFLFLSLLFSGACFSCYYCDACRHSVMVDCEKVYVCDESTIVTMANKIVVTNERDGTVVVRALHSDGEHIFYWQDDVVQKLWKD